MFARGSALALASLFLVANTASAQLNRYGVGLNVIVAEPVGEFSEYVDVGGGIELSGRLPLEPGGILSLKGEVGFLIYGHESKGVCFEGVGCRVQADLNTSNLIFFGGMGPELAIPMKAVRPYLNATMGFSYFSTYSSLQDDWGGEDHFSTQNFGDGTFSWAVGWGVEMRVSRGRVPISINLGAKYRQNGVMEYLTEGDIVDNPDGSITLFPNRSEANLITYSFGVTINLG